MPVAQNEVVTMNVFKLVNTSPELLTLDDVFCDARRIAAQVPHPASTASTLDDERSMDANKSCCCSNVS